MVDIPIAILCGGLATRLRPLTDNIPKSLVDVGGKPFIEHQLDLLGGQGLKRVVLCVGHLGEMIEQTVGDGSKFGLDVRYAYDGEKPMGTGGAIKRASKFLGDSFFIQYGDSYLDVDYAAVAVAFRRSGHPALMTVFRNAGQWDKSNVDYRDGTLLSYSKNNPTEEMAYIDYGLLIVNQAVLDRIPENDFFDLSTLFEELSQQGRLAGYEVHRRFYEIGTIDGLQETRRHLAE